MLLQSNGRQRWCDSTSTTYFADMSLGECPWSYMQWCWHVHLGDDQNVCRGLDLTWENNPLLFRSRVLFVDFDPLEFVFFITGDDIKEHCVSDQRAIVQRRVDEDLYDQSDLLELLKGEARQGSGGEIEAVVACNEL